MRMTRRILSLLLALLLSLALFGCDGFKLPFSEGAQSGGTQSGDKIPSSHLINSLIGSTLIQSRVG